MRALALLGLLAAAACGLEKGGLDTDSDAGSTSHPVSTDDASKLATGNDDAPGPEPTATEVDAPSGDAPSGDAPAVDTLDATDAPENEREDAEAEVGPGVPDAREEEAEDAPEERRAVDASKLDAGEVDATMDASEAAAPEAGPDGPAIVEAGPTCVSSIPKGWTVAIYDLGPDVCPTGFTDHDVQGPATLGSTACGCACDVTADGSCTDGTLSTFGDTANPNACGVAWFTVPITADSVCTTIPATVPAPRAIPESFEAAPLPGQGGTCASTVQSDPTQLVAPAARYCDVPAASAESVCNGTVPSGFAACIARAGAVACPAGTPFIHPFSVEDSATLACAACTACAVSTSCADAVVTVHTGAKCGDTGVSFNVDGTCSPTDFTATKLVTAVEYTATESSSCTAGTSTASAVLTNPVTICCL